MYYRAIITALIWRTVSAWSEQYRLSGLSRALVRHFFLIFLLLLPQSIVLPRYPPLHRLSLSVKSIFIALGILSANLTFDPK